MTSLLIKIFALPIAVIAADWLFPGVNYGAFYQAITVGLTLAVAGILMEYMMLREGTLWMSTIADFAAAVLIVYFVSNLFPGTDVTFGGAILTGALIAVAEHFLHLWLIRSGRTQKSPT